MSCPICESDDWDYTGDLPTIYELDDAGIVIQLDFKCHCPECGCAFYRREEFKNNGLCDQWIVKEDE